MSQSELRIFNGSHESTDDTVVSSTKVASSGTDRVTVSVGDIFPALADALATGKTWLKDFQNDEISIPYDLYEVILAYQHYQRLSA